MDVPTGEALEALRAWLLTEHAYLNGGVPDEVLNYLQDHISRLFGPRALSTAEDFLGRPDLDIAELARDRDRLVELLGLIEGGRRRGFELQWTAGPERLRADENGRPTALLVMAEYGVDDPVWDRPVGHGGPVSLSDLAVSESLVRRLREWNATFESSGLLDEWPGETDWVQAGLSLAHELQRGLPDIDVRYFHADDDRPLRSPFPGE